jgi:adenine-specific DNA-methyltransferase
MKRLKPLSRSKSSKIKHELIKGDALFEIKKLKEFKFDLILTSPPYNIGKAYEKRKSIEEYLSFQEEIIKHLIDLLSETGSICWQVGSYVHKKEIYPLDIFYYQIFKKYGLKLRNRIIWSYGHGLHAKKRFSGRYETILWFTKSDEYFFNLDSVRVKSKYPGKKHSKGPKKGLYSGNPLGKNPSDVWEIIKNDWDNNIWHITNVKSNHPEKLDHPCQFPIELVERCILALTKENDWVLDPFVGVGSTMIGAIKNNRNVVGIEREAGYCKIVEKRIKDFENGKLKIRELTKKISEPSKNMSVSKFPEEWTNQKK